MALQDADIDTLPVERAHIRIERDPRTRTATMDRSLMRLALRNLLSNALRYSPPGSPEIAANSAAGVTFRLVLAQQSDV